MSDYIHKIYPSTCDPKDYWKQIKRTVNGEPVSEDQIDLIIQSIKHHMNLSQEDNLLDIGCGNGALASYFFHDVNKYTGVDFSNALLNIAKRDFYVPNLTEYYESDAFDFINSNQTPKSYNKVLIYGCFSYFSKNIAIQIIDLLYKKYKNVGIVYLGNLPDRKMSEEFFKNRGLEKQDLDDDKSAIGVWWLS